MPFDKVAAAVGRTPAAVCQIAARAGRHVTAGAPRMDVYRSQHAAVVAVGVLTLHHGRVRRVGSVLAPDKLTHTHPDAESGQELT